MPDYPGPHYRLYIRGGDDEPWQHVGSETFTLKVMATMHWYGKITPDVDVVAVHVHGRAEDFSQGITRGYLLASRRYGDGQGVQLMTRHSCDPPDALVEMVHGPTGVKLC